MSSIDLDWLSDHLARIAEGIVAVVGPHCEVVVHDFRDLEHSVVAVAGNVTGRRVGAPVPDIGFISEGLDGSTPDQLNYRTTISSRNLQSSTIWIRDPEGNPIGAVCINLDYSGLQHARELLDILATSAEDISDFTVEDTFARDLDELIEYSIVDFLEKEESPSAGKLSYEGKLRLVQSLEERGLFRVRGAVGKVSELLGISRASVYNYRTQSK